MEIQVTSSSGTAPTGPEYSIFVGDLSLDVGDDMLLVRSDRIILSSICIQVAFSYKIYACNEGYH